MLVGEIGLHQSAVLLRPHPQINNPLVEPGGFEGACRHLRQRRASIQIAEFAAEGHEPVRCPPTPMGIAIRITWVYWCLHLRNQKQSDEVLLMREIDMRVCRPIPAHAEVTGRVVKDQMATGQKPVLHVQVLDRIGHEVRAALTNRGKPLVLTAAWAVHRKP